MEQKQIYGALVALQLSFILVNNLFYKGNPIFSGENEIDQLNYIMQYLGLPPREMIENSKRKHKFFNEQNEPLSPKNSKQKIRKPNSKKLEDFLGIEDKIFIDFIQVLINIQKVLFIMGSEKKDKTRGSFITPVLIRFIERN